MTEEDGCDKCGGQLVANGDIMICMDCGTLQDGESEISHG